MSTVRTPLARYLALQYTFHVIADPQGGYTVVFPDLPGCMTQVEDASDIPEMASEARELWIETEYGEGREIPLPSFPEEFSGKFNLRIGRSLHRRLVESAQREGVSLNKYAMSLLDRGDALSRVERRLAEMEQRLAAASPHTPAASEARPARRERASV